MNLFRRFLSPRPAARFDPPKTENTCFVIGDVHGCLSQLQLLLDAAPDRAEIICLGDYVDRGDDSAGVLRLLAERQDITCLKGNHEAMMLKFLEEPIGSAARWLRFGGLQTLASFGVRGGAETKDPALLTDLRDALRAAVGDDLIGWMSRLPCLAERGNIAIVHAGADPAEPVADQDPNTLIWGHSAFGKSAREDGIWILHGHTIVDAPVMQNGVISIDTGAYATGRLTAAVLSPDGCRFVQADGARLV